MSWVFSFPFFSQAIASLTEFGDGEDNAVPNPTEMRRDVSLCTKEVQDEDDGALLYSQAHGQAWGQQLGTVLVPSSPRQSPDA